MWWINGSSHASKDSDQQAILEIFLTSLGTDSYWVAEIREGIISPWHLVQSLISDQP
jgi:hypothetical protein